MAYGLELFAPHDVESRTRFVTSPVSGNTYRLAEKKRLAFRLRLGLWLDGIRNCRLETIDATACLHDFRPTTLPSLAPHQSEFLDRLWRDLEQQIGTASLKSIAARVGAIAPANDFSPLAAVQLAHGLRAKGRANCLLHSFWQAGLLRYAGAPCTLFVGLWMPMDEAHAWVVVPSTDGSVVLGDNVDRVMHYAPTIAFTFGEETFPPATVVPAQLE